MEESKFSKVAKEELTKIFENLKLQNVQLKEHLVYLTNENIRYKSLYENLTQRLNDLEGLLKINEEIFSNLLNNTKDLLQVGVSTVNSPLLPAKEKEYVHSPLSLKSKYSNELPVRPKIPIELLPLENLNESLDEQECTLAASQRNKILSTIWEESCIDVHNKTYNFTDVYVHITRLPNKIVEEHLRKMHEDSCNTSSDLSTLSTNLEPKLTSTPNQVDVTVQPAIGFVTTRKGKTNTNKSPTKRKTCSVQENKLSSPLKENNNVLTNMKNKTINNLRSPKVRRAKPKNLKEPTLKKKMRRVDH